MDDSVIRASTIFFLITLEEKELIYSAVEAALSSARKAQSQSPDRSFYSLVIEESTKVFRTKKYKSLNLRRDLELLNPPSDELLQEINALQKRLSDKVFIPFVWSEVVKAPLEDIAQGLELTIGTVEYRSYEVLKAWAEAE